MLCPFRECSCAVEGASGDGEQAQLGKTSAKGEAEQRGVDGSLALQGDVAITKF